MKKLFFFVVALCTTIVAHAETAEVTLASGSFDTDHITWTAADGNITISQYKGSSSTNVSSSYVATPRVYMGNYLAFVAAENYSITKISLTYTGSYSGNNINAGTKLNADGTDVVNNASEVTQQLATGSGGTHVFTTAGLSTIYIQNVFVSGGKQLRLTGISIDYTKVAATKPTIETAKSLDLGLLFKEEDFASKTLTVTGTQLTAAPTYTLANENSAFTVTGTLTADGGTLSVVCNTKAAGEYTDVLTLTAGDVKAEVALKAIVLELDGLGTKENPFTVTDILALNNRLTGSYWVKGFILGEVTTKGELATELQGTNIALGATADAQDLIGVQLVKGDARTDLNVNDHAANVGKEVKVFGSLESYNTIAGVKGVETKEHYEWISGTPTAIIESEINTSTVRKVIENGQVYIIRDGVRYNALGTVVK